MTQTVPYLAGTSSEELIYEAGQDVLLPIDPARRFKNYIVQDPDADRPTGSARRRRATRW